MSDQTILDQFHEIADRMRREGMEPVRVIFSHHGYMKALRENQASDNNPFETYLGLPYTIRSDMAGEIGLDNKFDKRRDAVTIQLGFDRKTGHILLNGNPHGEPIQTMQIIGAHLTKPQLCDIIQGYLSERHDSTDPFDGRLAVAVEKHGSFE